MSANWKTLFNKEILKLGKSYFLSGRAGKPEEGSDGYSVTVRGRSNYKVHLYTRWEKGMEYLEDMSCTCHYAVSGYRCKHMAAALFRIEGDFYPLFVQDRERTPESSGESGGSDRTASENGRGGTSQNKGRSSTYGNEGGSGSSRPGRCAGRSRSGPSGSYADSGRAAGARPEGVRGLCRCPRPARRDRRGRMRGTGGHPGGSFASWLSPGNRAAFCCGKGGGASAGLSPRSGGYAPG